MKRKFLLLLCMVVAFGMLFHSCQDDDNSPQVGLLLKADTNDWRKALRTQAEIYLNQYGLRYSVAQAATKQDSIINAMVSKGADVLILMPDGEITAATKETISSANDAGVSVIFAESAIEGTDYATLIQIDNQTIGASAAEFFNKQESLTRIALFTVKQDEVSSSGRIAGIKAGLKEALKDKVIEIPLEVYTVEAGRVAARAILSNAEYQDIDAIYAQDDDIALGVMDALETAKDERIKAVVGCGGSSNFFEKIKASETINLATTQYSPAQFMEKSVEVANNILQGIQPESKLIQLPSDLIDKGNVENYVTNAPY